MKKIIVILVILLILAGVGYALYSRYIAAGLSPTASIPAAKVKRGPFEITVSSIGILDAAVKKNVTAGFSGKIVKIIPEGTFVKEGDSLIWMDTSEYEESKKEYEVEVELAKANLAQKKEALAVTRVKNDLSLQAEKAKVEFQQLKLEDSKINYDKMKILVARNLAAKSAEDEARIAMLQAELTLKQAEINLKKLIEDQNSDIKIKTTDVEKAKVELERQQNKLDDVLDKIDQAVLKANGQGNVSYGIIWKGGKIGKVAEGDQVWRRATLMEIPDPSTMQALIPISEIDVGRIEEGQKATVTVDALPNQVYSGEVETKSVVPISENRSFWSQGSSTGPRGKEFEVRIKLEKPDDKFRQGMTTRSNIFINKIDDALFVPQEAVFSKEKDPFVFLKKDGSHEKRSVKIGLANDNYVVEEEGLKEGDEVFLRDPNLKIERIGELEGMKKRPEAMIKP